MTDITDAEIEAAARAICQFEADRTNSATCNPFCGACNPLARAALTAAAAVRAPVETVGWKEADRERLKEVLRQLRADMWHPSFASFAARIDAALASPPPPSPSAPVEPVGWKLVPVEPTPEMVAAWWRQKNKGSQEPGKWSEATSDYDAYRALIAASPPPPSPTVDKDQSRENGLIEQVDWIQRDDGSWVGTRRWVGPSTDV